jgi:hypothetical protein
LTASGRPQTPRIDISVGYPPEDQTMAKYFQVHPEVPGELGENTAMDASVHPPIVTHLHFVFTDWLGDCLITAFPCFLISQEALQELEKLPLTGYSTDTAEIEEGEHFDELFRVTDPDARLPRFLWLKVSGSPRRDDFALSGNGDLIVSDRALDALRRVGLTLAEITEA